MVPGLPEILHRIEYEGLTFDVVPAHRHTEVLAMGLEAATERLERLAGRKVKYNSAVDVQALLFQELGFVQGPKTGASLSALAHLSEEPVVLAINECKGLHKLIGTWATIAKHLNAGHLEFLFKEGRTFRLYTREYNVIGMPKQYRTFVRPSAPDQMFVHMDWRAAEFLLLAHEAGMDDAVQSYQDGVDIHALVAASIFDVPRDEVTSDQRNRAKQISYAVLYGGSTKENREKFFALWPKARVWVQRLKALGQANKYVLTMQDEQIPIDMELPEWEFQSVNYRYQGTVALLLQQKIVELTQDFPDVRIRVPSFDSVLLEVPSHYPAQYVYDLSRAFGELGTLLAGANVSFWTNVKVGNSWGEMTLFPNLNAQGTAIKDHAADLIYR
jgi:DNA polymerase-1